MTKAEIHHANLQKVGSRKRMLPMWSRPTFDIIKGCLERGDK